MKLKHIDLSIFIPVIVILILVCTLIVVFPENAAFVVNASLKFITYKLDWLYLFIVFGIMLFLGWLAFSKYGNIRFGDPNKQFSTLSWASMLFCASVGSSILYWGTIEWAYYFMSPPFGIEPYSNKAAEWAATYGLFHWGISAWSTYCLAGVVVGYSFYVKRDYIFRLSKTCQSVIGKGKSKAKWYKLIDIFVVIGLMAGVATSLGLGTPMISEGFHVLFGTKPTLFINIIIILIWGSIFGLSVYFGLEKGIKRLSDINIIIGAIIVAYVFINGKPFFVLSTFTNSIGLMFQNFIQMSFYTDPISQSGFPQDWTTFYWAWWIVYVPIVGLFIARISEGKTIRQIIIGTIMIGSAGCWIFFAVFGNYAMSLELDGILKVTEILSNQGAPVAIMEILKTLPFSSILIFFFIVLAFISLATSFDSVAYMLASIATKDTGSYIEPSRLHRVFWAFAITILPIALLFLGGLKTLQISSVVGSLPLTVIIIIMIIAFVNDLNQNNEFIKKRINIDSNNNN